LECRCLGAKQQRLSQQTGMELVAGKILHDTVTQGNGLNRVGRNIFTSC